MPGILIIQTAFIGDVVLATALVEKLHTYFPEQPIDFLVRKGNESLLSNNPYIRNVLVWNKKAHKYKNLFSLTGQIRKEKYDKLINVQRFFSTGLITAFSGAKERIGFNKNPLSFTFSKTAPHIIDPSNPKHEIERNQELISSFTDSEAAMPKLYPSAADFEKINPYIQTPFITISPSSVWFTKQYPAEKWIEFICSVPKSYKIFLLGGSEKIGRAHV